MKTLKIPGNWTKRNLEKQRIRNIDILYSFLHFFLITNISFLEFSGISNENVKNFRKLDELKWGKQRVRNIDNILLIFSHFFLSDTNISVIASFEGRFSEFNN